eukprot:930895-Amphidinium_carterae.1
MATWDPAVVAKFMQSLETLNRIQGWEEGEVEPRPKQGCRSPALRGEEQEQQFGEQRDSLGAAPAQTSGRSKGQHRAKESRQGGTNHHGKQGVRGGAAGCSYTPGCSGS